MTYEERRKRREEGQDDGTVSRYEAFRLRRKAKVAENVANSINERLQTWFKNNDVFKQNYQYRYGSRTGTYKDSYISDSSDWLETVTNQKNNFDLEAKSIISLMDEYSDFLDADYVKQAKEYLTSEQGYQNDIFKASSADVDHWSQWKDENAYKEWVGVQKQNEEFAAVDVKNERNRYERQMKELEEAKEWQKKLDKDRELRIYYPNDYHNLPDTLTDADIRNMKAWILALTGGKGVDEFEKYLSDKNVYLTQAERYQKSVELASVADAPDFEYYAGKGQSAAGRDTDQNTVAYWRNRPDALQQIKLDRVSGGSFTFVNSEGNMEQAPDYQVFKAAAYMTDEEFKIYNYYFEKDKNKAKEYLESIEETLNAREAEPIANAAGDNAALSLILKGAAGLDQFYAGMEGAWDMLTGNDAYVPPSAIQIAASSDKVNQTLGEVDLKWFDFSEGSWKDADIFGKSLGQTAGDLVQTTANQLPSIMMSFIPVVGQGLSLASMGISASGNAYTEMINAGYSKEQARSYGLLVGGSEVLLGSLLDGTTKAGGALVQKLGGKSFESFVKGIDNTFARVAISTGSRMLGEFTEESLQSVLEPWFESVVTKTDYEAANWEEVLYSGLLGALSAGALGNIDASNPNTALGATVKAVNKYKANVAVGKKISGVDGAVNRLVELGSVQSADSVAYKVAEKINKRVADGKKVGAYTIAKLFNAECAALTDANVADITKSLARKGVTEADAKTISAWMAKAVEGVPLTEAQANALENNPLLDKTFQDVIINPNSTVYQRTKQMSDFVSDVRRGEMTQSKATTATPATDTVKAVDTTESATTEEDATESKFKASVDGKTILTKTAEEVKPIGIESIKNGSVKVKLEDGKVVDASELSFATKDEAVLYEMVSKMNVSPESATSLIKNFKATDGVSAEIYAADIPLAYQYGKINYAKGLENLDLTIDQRQTAFYRGRNDAEAVGRTWSDTSRRTPGSNKSKASDDGIIYDGFELDEDTLTDIQKSSLAGIRTVAKMAPSLEIHITESVVENGKKYINVNGKKKRAPNGYFRNGNEIYIDIHAGKGVKGAMLYALSHEIVHFIAENSFKHFKALADFLFEHYGENNVPVDQLIKREINILKKSYKESGKELPNEKVLYMKAYEEVVANAMSKMFADPTSYEKLAKLKSENLRLWEKIGEAIKHILDVLKSKLGVYVGRTPDAMAAHYVDDFSAEVYAKLQDLYLKGFVAAEANYQASQNKGFVGKYTNRTYTPMQADLLASLSTEALQNACDANGALSFSIIGLGGNKAAQQAWIDAGLTYSEDGTVFVDENTVMDERDRRREAKKSENVSDVNTVSSTKGDTLYSVDDNFYAEYDAWDQKDTNKTFTIGTTSDSLTKESDTLFSVDEDIDSKRYSYEELTSKPDMKVKILPQLPVSEIEKYQKNSILFGKEMRDIASKANNPRNTSTSTYLYCTDLGVDVLITRDSFKHGAARMDATYIAVCKSIEDVLNNSVVINELTDREHTNGAYVLLGLAESVDSYVVVRSIVNKKTWKLDSYNELYAIKKKSIKKEDVGLKPPHYIHKNGYGTSSTISVAQFLEFVNSQNIANSVLSLDVINKLGLTRGFDENVTPDLLYSRKSPDSVSTRSLLANALESTVQNDIERNKLEQYKSKIELIESEYEKLSQLKAKIKELSFAKGPRDTKQIRELQDSATKTANRINIYDRQLLNLEATTALKNVLEREKARVRKAEAQKGKEALKAYREKAETELRDTVLRYQESRKNAIEGRHKTAERHAIARIAHDLDKLLNHGTKERNVKKGASALVRSALDLSNMLLATDDELLLAGVGTDYTTTEKVAIDRYMELYEEYHSYDNEVTEYKEVRKALRSQMTELKHDFESVLERERKRISEIKASSAYDALINGYESLKDSEDIYIKSAVKPEALAYLKSLKEKVGDTTVSDMTLDQLKMLHKAFNMVKKLVQDSNKIFRNGRMEDIRELNNTIFSEIGKLRDKSNKDYPEAIGRALNAINEMRWNNLRPIDAFELTGSEAFAGLFNDVLNAQNEVFANDIAEAKAFITQAREKHNYKKFDIEKTHTFTTDDGRSFNVTLGEMMSIYAYSKRKQADAHMRDGGFQHKKEALYKSKGIYKLRKSELLTYRVGDKLRLEIIGYLNQNYKDCKNYVDEVQGMLTEWGEKGNEASRVLYGIDLFTEEVYFPLMSSREYLSSVQNQLGSTATTASLSALGMAKPTVPNADNPIILQAFDDVVFEHLDKMSKYHAYVVPIENLRKVLDAQSKTPNGDMVSLRTLISTKLGEGASNYFEQYLTDLNGGTSISGAKNPLERFFGTAKGVSVSANISVWVQQYFSIIRAFAEIDPKYFIPFLGENYKKVDMSLYAEMKKYAPVTLIKEMGGFDVGYSQGVHDYIGYKETGQIKGKSAKIFNDALGIGAALMDKLGWMTIWKAVKKEVASEGKYKGASEEYFKACGKRFEEVIAKTQVYDSINAKSAFMRSKHGAVKYLVSFMGEPTTIVGMLHTATVKFQRAIESKDKAQIKKAGAKLATTVTSVIFSGAMTSVAKALVYAIRDDDEDETFLEKYAYALGNAFRDALNPLGYYPILRDVKSVWEGYTTERPDMSLIEDIVNSFKKVITEVSDEESTTEDKIMAGLNAALAMLNMLGVPLKNVYRDVKGIVKTLMNINPGYKQNFGEKFIEGLTQDETTKNEKLYGALMNNDQKLIEHYRSTYKTDTAFNSAVRSVLREHDPRIREAAQARIRGDIAEYTRIVKEITAEGKFVQDIVVGAINTEINAINKATKEESEEVEVDEATSIYRADDINAALESGDTDLAKEVITELISVKSSNNFNKAKAEAEKEGKRFDERKEREEAEKSARSTIKSAITKHWKKLYKEAYAAKDTAEMRRIREILYATRLYGTATELVETVSGWLKEE